MRFAYAHKMTTYLMVGSAFLSVVLSGEVSAILSLLLGLALIASWFWEPPRIDFAKYDRMWVVVAILSFAYGVFDFLTGGDILLAGVHFLLTLVILKLFNRKASKDYLHVYILAFLMVVAATVLNSDISYGVFFLCFVVSSTWAMILFHLRRDMENSFLFKQGPDEVERQRVDRILNSRRIVGKKFFLGTSVVSLVVFAGASVLFLAIPRIGLGFFFSQSRSGITMAGFSDGVELGGHGVIKDDRTVVMRVKVPEAYQGATAPAIHWRGVAFDRYYAGNWVRSLDAPRTRRHLSYEDGSSRHYLLYQRPDTMIRPRQTLAGKLRQEIYLEPTGSDVLFAAAMPHAFEFVESAWKELAKKARNDEIRYPHVSGLKYVVYSNLDRPSADVLRASKTELPPDFGVYVQVPKEIPERVRELAREITRGATNRYDQAVAIESWLENNLGYTLEMKSPGQMEPIDFFLFERKKGHCEYFASAMAILLRTLGVPTRNVNGFLGGEWNEYDQYIAVRSGDAHSWVEVYFPDYGWVEFDPTPAAQIEVMGRGQLGFLDRMRRYTDTIRVKWFKWVIEYDLYRQMQLLQNVAKPFRGKGNSMRAGTDGMRTWLREHKFHLLAGIGGILLAVVAVQFWRRRGSPQRAGGRARGYQSNGAISTIYRSVLHRYEKRGFARPISVTPREFVETLKNNQAFGAAPMEELTRLYYEVEYGSASARDALARARQLKQDIEQAAKASPA